MAVDLPEELPSSEVEKASLLEGILERGIEKLLEEVKAKKYLQVWVLIQLQLVVRRGK